MDDDLMACDVVEDALVRGGSTPEVMLPWQTID
jgi:hypothetical protein